MTCSVHRWVFKTFLPLEATEKRSENPKLDFQVVLPWVLFNTWKLYLNETTTEKKYPNDVKNLKCPSGLFMSEHVLCTSNKQNTLESPHQRENKENKTFRLSCGEKNERKTARSNAC